MSYSVPKVEKPKFDESKWFKDINIKNVQDFKDLDRISEELLTLTEKEKCAKLISYVKKKKSDIVTIILRETEINPNFTDKSGNSPLHYAVYYGLVEITTRLLYFGAENNFINKYGETAIEAGRTSISENIKNVRYIKNNTNIENCIKKIENSIGRINIDELKQDININAIRDNLNKIQEENKQEILEIINLKAKCIIDDKKKITSVFEMIFQMAKDNDLFLGVYVDVIKNILTLDRSYNLPKGLLHIVLAKAYEYYLKALQDPTLIENQNIIKFITHFYSPDLMNRRFLQKIIEDLFYVIEQSYDQTDKVFKEQECIRLLQIVLMKIKPDSNKACNAIYTNRFKKYLSPEYKVKPRLKFLIKDYLEL